MYLSVWTIISFLLMLYNKYFLQCAAMVSVAQGEILNTVINFVPVRPEFTGTLAIKSGRHPILETLQSTGSLVPNDVYCDDSSSFQIIQGPKYVRAMFPSSSANVYFLVVCLVIARLLNQTVGLASSINRKKYVLETDRIAQCHGYVRMFCSGGICEFQVWFLLNALTEASFIST